MADKFQTHELQIPPRLAGMRLDQALALLLPEYSRSRLKGWIEAGRVRLDRRQPRPRDVVSGGERVAVEAEIATNATVEAQAIALDIVHADEDLLIVNKPAGLVVHPGAGNRDRTLQNALLHFDAGLAALPRAGILHRLDKDTTGLLVVARTLASHTELTRQMQAREIEREYAAICSGVMTAGGTVDRPIGRHRSDRVRMAVREDGREAVTHYRVLARFRAHTHVRVSLETGRTHQIRVHFAHLRHPLVGDSTYGGRLLLPRGATAELVAALREFPRQALHAARLRLTHPRSGQSAEWQAPLPEDMRQLLAVLRKDAAARSAR
ncbi:MAG TPA: 23S rRNA pseudouridine(1911/1915/1917) synthase RluD [Steroidobacteraceae bacterium]|nr:23S rRNA pseudouridine(1911/1915/1917) synthase RluD [Steroidobacteraceae bacterium]